MQTYSILFYNTRLVSFQEHPEELLFADLHLFPAALQGTYRSH